MLSKEEKRAYLKAQKEQVEKAQFRSEVAQELATRRLEKAKHANKFDEAAKLETQLEEVAAADEGNEDYLELIDELLRKL